MASPSIFQTRGRPVRQDALADLETSIGSLPDDYRNFLSEGDGARLVQFNTVFGSEFGGVREIFAVADRDGSYRKLPDVLRTYANRVPPGFLPIADDQAGNLFCIALMEPNRGEIYFWDHDFEAEEGEEPTQDNMHRVARSLMDLLDRIHLED